MKTDDSLLRFEGGKPSNAPGQKERCCAQDCFEPEWATPTCCWCFPVEKGLRILMWFTIVGACLSILGLVGALMQMASNPIAGIFSIIQVIVVCYQAFLFIQFIKNDNLETREMVVKAFMIGFLMMILSNLLAPLSAMIPCEDLPDTSAYADLGIDVPEVCCGACSFFAAIPGAILSMIIGIVLNFYCWKNSVNFMMRLKPSEYKEEVHGVKVFGCC